MQVVQRVIVQALQDGHPLQGSSQKLLMERLIPIQKADPSTQRRVPQIVIHVGESTSVQQVEVIDADYHESAEGDESNASPRAEVSVRQPGKIQDGSGGPSVG